MGGDAGNDRVFGDAGNDCVGRGDGDDVLEGGTGADGLYGDAGDDVLVGGAGADVLFGHGGADRFVFLSVTDSLASARDRVGDFNATEGDRIDLSAIDADVNAAGDQAFVLVGAFTGVAGQAVATFDERSGGMTLLADVDGDGRADFGVEAVGNFRDAPIFIL